MEPQNINNTVMEFVLLGFNHSPESQQFLFVYFFIIYLMTCLGNITILITVITEYHLRTPMYFFLAKFAVIDVVYCRVLNSNYSSSAIRSPLQNKTIPFNECFLQMFFFHFIGGAHIFVLTAMAAGSYVAIHKPLQCLTIMNREVCVGVVAGSWGGGFVHSVIQIALLLHLPYCDPNTLDSFCCDVPQVLKLACTDTYLTKLLMVSSCGLLLIIIFILLLISYTVILVKIKKQVTEKKHKALSTCIAQIMVISFIFIPGIFIYAQPFKKFALAKVASISFTVIVPILNQMIYSLRNAEMKKAIRRLVSKHSALLVEKKGLTSF